MHKYAYSCDVTEGQNRCIKLHPSMSCCVLSMISVLINQQYTANKVSLNRNIHGAR